MLEHYDFFLGIVVSLTDEQRYQICCRDVDLEFGGCD